MTGHIEPSTSLYGLILARKNSKGIPSKNTSLLNGEPLIVRSLKVMKKSGCFAEIWVSTDDDLISDLSKAEGANVHRRQSYTATDEASSVLAIQEFLTAHPEKENLCLVQCTSPFLKEDYLKEGSRVFSSGFDSVFSVTRKHLFRWSQETPSKPLNFPLEARPRRQSFSGDLCENGMFYFFRRKFATKGVLQGGRVSLVTIPEEDSLDIDTPLDLFLAQQILNFRSGLV